MRELRAAVRTTPRAVSWVTALSLLILLGKIIFLNSMPAPFPSAHDLGLVVEALLGANVAAYVFFIISCQLPKIMEKQRVGAPIVQLAERAADAVLRFPATVAAACLPQSDVVGFISWGTAEGLESLFDGVRANAHSTSINIELEPLSWFEGMIDAFRECRSVIEELWRYAPFIDADLASRLHNLRFSDYWRNMEEWIELTAVKNRTLEDMSLKSWSRHYFIGYRRAVELKRFCAEFRRLYGIA
jgi:hypothetical protein